MIFAIGDSHINIFSGQFGIPEEYPKSYSVSNRAIVSCNLGKVSSLDIYKKHGIIRNFLFSNGARRGDIIIISSGELDCRHHIPKLIKYNENIDSAAIIQNSVEKLFIEISNLIKDGFNIITYSVPPTTMLKENEETFIYGDIFVRNTISLRYNQYLEYKSRLFNIQMINIFDELVDYSMISKTEFFIDQYHLNPSIILPLIEQKYFQYTPIFNWNNFYNE
jgi:hypothetical protein